ncbi:YCII-related domain-containing protein [Hirsutella rhossiliensis]|uniref:YCII-related domain-containing protein n=1 Tax=Hirsutella rhossiliensis TaxID=111463 RepID=A0A9P8MQJ0_9HYPO|nr:YCII-related domain-containing protein [Hirsutella rhossiliensis]KAH0959400.1 YCII-related domain-containing protein [Hirsutella rhossiliensis]
MPRYILFIKSDPHHAESDNHEPSTDNMHSFVRFNEEMAQAGVLLDAEGFKPTADSYRIKYDSSAGHEVVKGPFDVSKEDHVGGYWLIHTKTSDEALKWAKKVPLHDGEVIMRTVGYGHHELSTHTKELKDREHKLRAQMEMNRKAVDV